MVRRYFSWTQTAWIGASVRQRDAMLIVVVTKTKLQIINCFEEHESFFEGIPQILIVVTGI